MNQQLCFTYENIPKRSESLIVISSIDKHLHSLKISKSVLIFLIEKIIKWP